MLAEKKWYAVYTKPRWEKKVAQLFDRKKIENYCPLNKSVRQWHDRRKIVLEPLFTSYVFVYASKEEHAEIRKTDGVVNFVYWLGAPAVIRTEEITIIKDFLARHESVQLERNKVSVADRVRITDGLLIHHQGEVREVKSKTVKVLLPSLGYMMVAEISKSVVEVVAMAPQHFKQKGYVNAEAV